MSLAIVVNSANALRGYVAAAGMWQQSTVCELVVVQMEDVEFGGMPFQSDPLAASPFLLSTSQLIG